MENFNLKKFLTENKLTTNSKVLNEGQGASLGIELGADGEVGMEVNPKPIPTDGGFKFNPATEAGDYVEAYIYIENQPELVEKLHSLYTSQNFEELNLELDSLIQQHTGMNLDSFTNPEESLEEENAVGDGYVEAMGDQFQDACDQLVQAWEAWKNGPETVEEDIEGAKADVLAYIKRKLR